VPVAVADAFTVPANKAFTGNLGANDKLSSDGAHLWWLWSTPANGSLTVNANGTFTYTPKAGFSGSDRFTYALRDADRDQSNAEVRITVTTAVVTTVATPVLSSVPVAVADAFTMTMNKVLTGNLGANDKLSSAGGHLWWLWSTPANGKLTVNANGTFTYTPKIGFTGTDRFTYALRDAKYVRSNATVTVTVRPAT
ncbi:MAG: Ig-like domain-containing protein, partial [Limisphaerales bacterium]